MKSGRGTNLLLSLAVVVVTLGSLEGACRPLRIGQNDPVARYIVNWNRQWHDDVYFVMAGDGFTERVADAIIASGMLASP